MTSPPGGGSSLLAAYLDTNKEPGDTVELEVVRGNDEVSVEATLAQWPS